MIAWHGEPGLKAAAMERLREHRRRDEIQQGYYWTNDGRGCQLGCLAHTSIATHDVVERLFGIPVNIGYLLETVFEHLPVDECAAWVLDSTDAIPVGADFSLFHSRFSVLMLDLCLKQITIPDRLRAAVSSVRDLHQQMADGQYVKHDKWRDATNRIGLAAFALPPGAGMAHDAALWSMRAAQDVATAGVPEIIAKHPAVSWVEICKQSISCLQECPVPEREQSEPSVTEPVRMELCSRGLWCPDGVTA